MDPRNRADETLARARARGAFVVTPDSATSPMDAAQTVRIPREAVPGAEQEDADSTQVIPDSTRQGTQGGQQAGQSPGTARQQERQQQERPAGESPAGAERPSAEHPGAERAGAEQRAWPDYDADIPTKPHRIDDAAHYQHDPRRSPQQFD